MCCCHPEFRRTLHDVGQERSPRSPGVLPGWAGPSWFRASELNGDRFGEAGEAVHLISMSIPNMTHGSIEEVLQRPATRMT